MSQFVKVMFGNKGANYTYKIGEVNVATIWNPNALNGKDFGGFNYCTEECILRWFHRGDTLYDVEIPEEAEVIRVQTATEVYQSNQIILKNPRKVDDDLAYHFYEISHIPEKSYYKALAAVSIMGYRKTAMAILKDKVNSSNIDLVLSEWNDFMESGNKYDRSNGLVNEVETYLKNLK